MNIINIFFQLHIDTMSGFLWENSSYANIWSQAHTSCCPTVGSPFNIAPDPSGLRPTKEDHKGVWEQGSLQGKFLVLGSGAYITLRVSVQEK